MAEIANPVSTGISHEPDIRTEIVLPNELKLMIFKLCDLETFKALRLTSNAWAGVGLDALLLPTFVFLPHWSDVARLRAIGQHPVLSQRARTIIKTLVFVSYDWKLEYIRNLFSRDRNQQIESNQRRRVAETYSLIPTEDERKALDELDILAKTLVEPALDSNLEWLAIALSTVSKNCSIEMYDYPGCVFRHRLLQETWHKWHPKIITKHRVSSLEVVLAACKVAGLHPKNLLVSEMSSVHWAAPVVPSPQATTLWNMQDVLRDVECLSIYIDDSFEKLRTKSSEIYSKIRAMFAAVPNLRTLSIAISHELISHVEKWAFHILPDHETCPYLESLAIADAQINGPNFIAYLKSFKSTLKKLQLINISITSGQMQWKELLTQLRSVLDLERFILAGNVQYTAHKELWNIRPHCDMEWDECRQLKETRSRELEQFMVADGPWPMLPEDNRAKDESGSYVWL